MITKLPISDTDRPTILDITAGGRSVSSDRKSLSGPGTYQLVAVKPIGWVSQTEEVTLTEAQKQGLAELLLEHKHGGIVAHINNLPQSILNDISNLSVNLEPENEESCSPNQSTRYQSLNNEYVWGFNDLEPCQYTLKAIYGGIISYGETKVGVHPDEVSNVDIDYTLPSR